MPTDTSRVTIHMDASLDFFIARKDGSVSWLETTDSYEQGVTAEDSEEFMKAIDCFVMGSRTYELAMTLGWPYGEVPTIVLTHRNLPAHTKSVEFLSGDLATLVHEKLRPRYRNIWVVGGPMLAREFLRLNLADEIRIALMPILLGDGIPFVDNFGHEQALHLKDVKAYKDGMVELVYEIRSNMASPLTPSSGSGASSPR